MKLFFFAFVMRESYQPSVSAITLQEELVLPMFKILSMLLILHNLDLQNKNWDFLKLFTLNDMINIYSKRKFVSKLLSEKQNYNKRENMIRGPTVKNQ